MKITFVTPIIGYGGRYKMLVWYANVLSRNGFDVSIIVSYKYDILQKVDDKINVIELGFDQSGNRYYRNSIELIKVVSANRKMIKKLSPDLIISFGDSIGCVLLALKKSIGIPFLTAERIDPYTSLRFGDRMKRKLFVKSDFFMFQTKKAREFYKSLADDKCIVLPNPVVKTNYLRDVSRVDNHIVNVGRFEIRQKRQDLMVDAFNIVHQKYPDVILSFYGDGNEMSIIKEKVKEYKLDDYVEFKGKVNPIEPEIVNSKMFVLSSDYEGIPNALIEAMTLGIPSVSTDCSPGGAALLIDSPNNGVLVPTNDAQKLADGMLYILEDNERAEALGLRGKEISTVFSPESIEDKWVSFIKKLFAV